MISGIGKNGEECGNHCCTLVYDVNMRKIV